MLLFLLNHQSSKRENNCLFHSPKLYQVVQFPQGLLNWGFELKRYTYQCILFAHKRSRGNFKCKLINCKEHLPVHKVYSYSWYDHWRGMNTIQGILVETLLRPLRSGGTKNECLFLWRDTLKTAWKIENWHEAISSVRVQNFSHAQAKWYLMVTRNLNDVCKLVFARNFER